MSRIHLWDLLFFQLSSILIKILRHFGKKSKISIQKVNQMEKNAHMNKILVEVQLTLTMMSTTIIHLKIEFRVKRILKRSEKELI